MTSLAADGLFPVVEPFASGWLDTADGNEIYWEASGNPEGLPAVWLHGGPGSGNPRGGYRRRFDPERYWVLAFDQRGCGRSRPLVTDALETIAGNTTQALIADIEALRRLFAVERWLVTGGSWGSTLALAYAQEHPERVSGVAVVAVTGTSAAEVEWITESVGRIFPEEWERFAAAVGTRPGQRVVDAYYEKLLDADPAVRADAARTWCRWEETHIRLDPNWSAGGYEDPAFCEVFATLVVHYWKHAAFLGEDGVYERMHRLDGIPGALIHGRHDVSGPAITAWRLHRAWPGSRLVIVEDEGHGGPKMMRAMREAVSGLADAAG